MASGTPRISREGIKHPSLRAITDMVLNIREGKVDTNRALSTIVNLCKKVQADLDGNREGRRLLQEDLLEVRLDLKKLREELTAKKPKPAARKKS